MVLIDRRDLGDEQLSICPLKPDGLELAQGVLVPGRSPSPHPMISTDLPQLLVVQLLIGLSLLLDYSQGRPVIQERVRCRLSLLSLTTFQKAVILKASCILQSVFKNKSLGVSS